MKVRALEAFEYNGIKRAVGDEFETVFDSDATVLKMLKRAEDVIEEVESEDVNKPRHKAGKGNRTNPGL